MPSDLQQQADSRLEGPARFGASTPGPPVGKGLNTPSIGAVAAVKPFADALAGTRPMEVGVVDHNRALGFAATCRRCCSLATGINFGSQGKEASMSVGRSVAAVGLAAGLGLARLRQPAF